MNILNTSKKFLKAGVCAIMLITAGQAQAQQVTVDASIDSLQLLIGEHILFSRSLLQVTEVLFYQSYHPE